jgi:hypothetical protein
MRENRARYKELKAWVDGVLKKAQAWPFTTGEDGVRRRTLPDQLTVRELQGILCRSYGATLRYIRRNLKPMGAVSYTGANGGGHLLIAGWGVAKVLNMDERCPGCGKPWPTEGNGAQEGGTGD